MDIHEVPRKCTGLSKAWKATAIYEAIENYFQPDEYILADQAYALCLSCPTICISAILSSNAIFSNLT